MEHILTPHFFILISFIIFGLAMVPIVKSMIIPKLKAIKRSIASQINSYKKEEEDSQDALSASLKDLEEAVQTAETIVNDAKKEAEIIISNAKFKSQAYYNSKISEIKTKAAAIERMSIEVAYSESVNAAMNIVCNYLDEKGITTLDADELKKVCTILVNPDETRN